MLWLLAVTAVAAEPKTPEPKDFIELMEKSPHHYKIEGASDRTVQWTQQNAMRAWERRQEPLVTVKRVKKPSGGWSVAACRHEPEAAKMLEVSQAMFEAKDYKGAEAEYEKILERFPDDYEVHLDWGDTALLTGRAKEALARYEAAGKRAAERPAAAR